MVHDNYCQYEIISKLDPCYNKGILLGYNAGTSSYQIWDTERCKLAKMRDVILPLSSNTKTGLELIEIEDRSINLGKPLSTPKLEEIDEELDDLQMKQSMPTCHWATSTSNIGRPPTLDNVVQFRLSCRDLY